MAASPPPLVPIARTRTSIEKALSLNDRLDTEWKKMQVLERQSEQFWAEVRAFFKQYDDEHSALQILG